MKTLLVVPQLATFCIVHALSSHKCHLRLPKKKGNLKDLYYVFGFLYLDFCSRWTTIMTSLFTLHCTPSNRLYNYLNLLVLYNVSSVRRVF